MLTDIRDVRTHVHANVYDVQKQFISSPTLKMRLWDIKNVMNVRLRFSSDNQSNRNGCYLKKGVPID